MGILLLAFLPNSFGMEQTGEEIDTLDVIEITGSVIEQRERTIIFPIPEIQHSAHQNPTKKLQGPKLTLSKPIPSHSHLLLDHTAQTRDLHTPVKPLKTERPPYPRQARQQGWQGRVIVRLNITAKGTVESGTVHQSSGHPLLDDNAVNAATQWTFEPAKNGGFPVATTVNIPIQFDLVE